MKITRPFVVLLVSIPERPPPAPCEGVPFAFCPSLAELDALESDMGLEAETSDMPSYLLPDVSEPAEPAELAELHMPAAPAGSLPQQQPAGSYQQPAPKLPQKVRVAFDDDVLWYYAEILARWGWCQSLEGPSQASGLQVSQSGIGPVGQDGASRQRHAGIWYRCMASDGPPDATQGS